MAGSGVAGGNREGTECKRKEGERKRGQSQARTEPVLSLFLAHLLITVTVSGTQPPLQQSSPVLAMIFMVGIINSILMRKLRLRLNTTCPRSCR